MKILLIGVLFLIIGFASCQKTSTHPPVLKPQHFRSDKALACDSTTGRGVSIDITYPLLEETSTAERQINDSLRHLAVGSVAMWVDSATLAQQPSAATNLNATADLLVKDYQDFANQMQGRPMGGCWELIGRIDTTYTSPKAITLQAETMAYLGGAHPNTQYALFTFDRQTGQPIRIADSLTDTTALLKLVEPYFRQKMQINSQQNLEEVGFFLHEGRFFLPANMGFSHEGMVFFYNPYEIAAYAVGPISVVVPYDKLNGLVKPIW